MSPELALSLSDIRLLQTLRLLESSMNDHPDYEAVKEALDAVKASRDKIAKLMTTPEIVGKCCA